MNAPICPDCGRRMATVSVGGRIVETICQQCEIVADGTVNIDAGLRSLLDGDA